MIFTTDPKQLDSSMVSDTLNAPAFRGDSRLPEEIFQAGFHARKPHDGPKFRASDFDVDPESAVCATRNARVACWFPLDSSVEQTYVYVFIPTVFFDTFQEQLRARESVTNPQARSKLEILLVARELAVGGMGVPGNAILGAYSMQRRWKSNDDWRQGFELQRTPAFLENRDNAYRNTAAYSETLQMVNASVAEIPLSAVPKVTLRRGD